MGGDLEGVTEQGVFALTQSRMKYEKVHSIYNRLLAIEDIDPTLVRSSSVLHVPGDGTQCMHSGDLLTAAPWVTGVMEQEWHNCNL